MDPIIKQRLVGTLVLIALGIVFWPIIFVQPDTDDSIALEPMPPRPVIDETPIPKPESAREEILAEIEGPAVDPEAQAAADEATLMTADESDESEWPAVAALLDASELDPGTVRGEAPQEPAIDEAGFALSWVLQVATVSTEARADRLVNDLKSKGYTAFHRKIPDVDKALWRIQIGPKLERDKLVAIQAEVDRALAVKSAIIRYVQ